MPSPNFCFLGNLIIVISKLLAALRLMYDVLLQIGILRHQQRLLLFIYIVWNIFVLFFLSLWKTFGRVYVIATCNPTVDIVLWNTLNYSNTELDIRLSPHIHPVCENSEYKVHTTLDWPLSVFLAKYTDKTLWLVVLPGKDWLVGLHTTNEIFHWHNTFPN